MIGLTKVFFIWTFMNKLRLEALADAVFAIVMTLLVIEIKVPELHGAELTPAELWQELVEIGPLFMSYFVSFAVLSMFWTSHHAFFQMFIKNLNRLMVQFNMLYLAFIALIPFSAHLLGTYPDNLTAVLIYGSNIILAGVTAILIFMYALKSNEIEMHEVERRTLKQGTIRLVLTPFFAIIGMLVAFINLNIALTLFAFPIIFNIIPGSLNFLERVFRFRIE